MIKILISALEWAKEVVEHGGNLLSAFLTGTKGEYGVKKGRDGGTDINTPGRTLRKK